MKLGGQIECGRISRLSIILRGSSAFVTWVEALIIRLRWPINVFDEPEERVLSLEVW
jgi:hypothetical protein